MQTIHIRRRSVDSRINPLLFSVVLADAVDIAEKLVPDIVAGGSLGGVGTLVDVLLASVIRDRTGVNGAVGPATALEKAS